MDGAGDEALMRAWTEGDVIAFERLYGRYRGPLFRYFRRQVSDSATAGDLYQGCWEKVIRARARYRESAPFRAWLFRIAHNHLVDHYRAQRTTAPLDDQAAAPGDGPESHLDRAQRTERFRRALDGLPPEQREALLLKIEGGFDTAQIADITGVGAETAKSRLRYATARLKQALGP